MDGESVNRLTDIASANDREPAGDRHRADARGAHARSLFGHVEVSEVLRHALLQGRRGDALAELVGLVRAANTGPRLVDPAPAVAAEVRTRDAEGLVERGNVGGDAARSA